MYPAGALLVARAIQEERLRHAAKRERSDIQRPLRPIRPGRWSELLRFPRMKLADAKG